MPKGSVYILLTAAAWSLLGGVVVGDSEAPAGGAPEWFVEEIEYLTRDGGRWIADNRAYEGEEEPYPEYGIEWETGLSGLTASGRLFGIDTEGRERDFWELHLYWDPLQGRAVAMQVHADGSFGLGELTFRGPSERELVQELWAPGGQTSRLRHVEHLSEHERRAETFLEAEGEWRPRRSYVWKRVGR
jgi:hypothetical protein